MAIERWFWGSLTAGCLLWYATVTVYIAIRGAHDIKEMLARLGKRRHDEDME